MSFAAILNAIKYYYIIRISFETIAIIVVLDNVRTILFTTNAVKVNNNKVESHIRNKLSRTENNWPNLASVRYSKGFK